MPEREQVRAEDGSGPLRFVRYLLKFTAGFLAVSIPQFALVALFLRILGIPMKSISFPL